MKVQLRSPEIFYNYYMALTNSTLNDLLCKESEMFYYYTRMHGSIQRNNVHDAPHAVLGDVLDPSAMNFLRKVISSFLSKFLLRTME